MRKELREYFNLIVSEFLEEGDNAGSINSAIYGMFEKDARDQNLWRFKSRMPQKEEIDKRLEELLKDPPKEDPTLEEIIKALAERVKKLEESLKK
jgi:hypothetical protein